uniref:Integrin alpha-D-like n=1 Tax=Neolamprologus brichardi TaxID=32507 RepID=A0A3Q4HGW0_NEOBR
MFVFFCFFNSHSAPGFGYKNSFNTAPDLTANVSLGMSMESDPSAENTVVCCPSIPKHCKSITMYNGVCFQIDSSNSFGPPIPSSLDDCETQVDLAFLLDGSGSVSDPDFRTMKKFVRDLIVSFLSSDTQFSVSQFSSAPEVHFNFKKFNLPEMEDEINKIQQHVGTTFTAKAIKEGIQMSIVGANQWRGGYVQYTTGGQKVKTYEDVSFEPDSYLGYSMAIAKAQSGSLTVLGAPRYKHRGVVVSVNRENFENQTIEPLASQYQTGEYFGAEVCTMDINNDDITELIFISAPMYTEPDREGRVYVCTLTGLFVECNFHDPLILRGHAGVKGRFGSSLAVLPDLNGDGFNDLAVGAPLENGGEGSIYIFHSEGGRISPTYSQRITGSEVQSGLKFFGLSISQSAFDQSGDGLLDLAVGSKGKVVLLRSRPIVEVKSEVSFSPNQISTQNVDCSKPLENTVTVCFTMSSLSTKEQRAARIDYMLTLDTTRKPSKKRAYFSEKEQERSGSIIATLGKKCSNVTFFIEACPEDALSPLSNEIKFSFYGLPSDENLTPSLSPHAPTATNYPVRNVCDSNANISSEVKVGIDELLNVTVTVENRGENSYKSRVILTYPAGLSYRKFTSQQGRIECKSLDSEDGLSRGRTDCTIDKPIFKSQTKASFIVFYGIDTNSQFERKIFVTANATSGNQEHAPTSELYKKKLIDVKYSIFMTIKGSPSYNNFTFGKNDLQKPVQQSITLTNDIRALHNFTVWIKVPVKLGGKDIWVHPNNLQIADCKKGSYEEPHVKDFVPQIQKNKVVDCSVAMCRVFECKTSLERQEKRTYEISGNLTSQWIEQIGLQSAKFLLTSQVSLKYDRSKYVYFSTGSDYNSPVHKIEAEVEVYPEPDFIKEIIGGCLGGLFFLILLTVVLYKAGFFKSKYSKVNTEEPEDGAGGDVPTG